jgi:ABC-type dipeptide/oligopeptide/nickel transport system permease subunit
VKGRRPNVGLWLLLALAAGSFAFGALWPSALRDRCPFGMDVLRPDQSVCELAFGGLWVSLGIGLGAGALSTLLGFGVAALARALGGLFERWTMRLADSFFALPDVLVLMVLQLAGQVLGDVNPAFRLSPAVLMIVSLAIIGWAGPSRMFRNRLVSLEAQEYVAAARALGSSPRHLLARHLWPALRPFALALFLSRVPAAILAESTVSFFGIARMEPMSLGRYLGTSYASLVYEGGARIVLPAWGLLVLVVLAATLASRSAAAARG